MKTHVYTLNTSDNTNITIGDEIKCIETRSTVTALSYTTIGDMLAIGDQNKQIELGHNTCTVMRLSHYQAYKYLILGKRLVLQKCSVKQ